MFCVGLVGPLYVGLAYHGFVNTGVLQTAFLVGRRGGGETHQL